MEMVMVMVWYGNGNGGRLRSTIGSSSVQELYIAFKHIQEPQIALKQRATSFNSPPPTFILTETPNTSPNGIAHTSHVHNSLRETDREAEALRA